MVLGNILEIKEESLNDRNFGIVSGRIQPTHQSLPRFNNLHKTIIIREIHWLVFVASEIYNNKKESIIDRDKGAAPLYI